MVSDAHTLAVSNGHGNQVAIADLADKHDSCCQNLLP